MKSIFNIAALASLASAQWIPDVPVDHRSLDEIYEAAKQEQGTLVVSAGGDAADQNDMFIQYFLDRFPEIKLDWTVDLSKYHDSRIDREWYEDDPKTDVVLLQTLHDYPRWKSQNRLLYYKPPTFDQIYASEKDLDGAYVPFWINTFGRISYDCSKIDGSEVPESFADFADPKWKGKLVLTYPNDDDAIAFLFSTIISKYGMDWLDALAANDVLWLRGTYSPEAAIAARHNTSSERALTFTAIVGSTAEWWNFKDPSEDLGMAWSQTAAILSSTKMPETAKLLVAYFTSEEFNNIIAATGANVPLKNIDRGALYDNNVTEITHFREFQENRATVEWWKLQYETILGTPQGPSPLDVYTRQANGSAAIHKWCNVIA